MKTKSKRMANVELLRILAMLMIVMLHYLGKGNLLPVPSTSMDSMGYMAWILESLCIVAVNVYVLISGYFLVESHFKASRVVELILQILFYTIVITIIAYAFGFGAEEGFGLYNLLLQIVPIPLEEYWFMTAYLLLYVLSPILAAGVKAMTQKQLKCTIGMMLLIVCIPKSLLIVDVSLGNHGYDVIWFICLFLIAGYIRLYGIEIFEKKSYALLLYFGSCFLILAESFALGVLYEKTGKLGTIIDGSYDYNHIFTLMAAIGLFQFFLKINIPEGKINSAICKIAPYTLGVYLLHEQTYIRFQWVKWLKAGSATNAVSFLFMALGAVLVVFCIGILVDYLRSLLFQAGSKVIYGKKNRTSDKS